jgi:hypothetical protein
MNLMFADTQSMRAKKAFEGKLYPKWKRLAISGNKILARSKRIPQKGALAGLPKSRVKPGGHLSREPSVEVQSSLSSLDAMRRGVLPQMRQPRWLPREQRLEVSVRTLGVVENALNLFKKNDHEFALSSYFLNADASVQNKIASKFLMIVVGAAINRRDSGESEFEVIGPAGFDFYIATEIERLIPRAPGAGNELLNALSSDLKVFLRNGGEFAGSWGYLGRVAADGTVVATLTKKSVPRSREINKGRSI